MRLLASMRIRLTGVRVFKQDLLIKYLSIWWTMFPTIRPFDSVPNPVNRFSREMLRKSVLCKEVNSHQLPEKKFPERSLRSLSVTRSGKATRISLTGYSQLETEPLASVSQPQTSQHGSLHIDTRMHKTHRDRISLVYPHPE